MVDRFRLPAVVLFILVMTGVATALSVSWDWMSHPSMVSASSGRCSTLPGAGVWTDQHSFPRLVAVNAAYNSSNQQITNYDELAAYDIALSGSYLADWTNSSRLPVSNYAAYLRNRNPHIKLLPFFHAYGFLNPSMLGSAQTFPDVHAVSQALNTAGGAGGNGWWLMSVGNTRVSPWASSPYDFLRNQALINWSFLDPTNSTTSFPVWMSQYVNQAILGKTYGNSIPYWDGFVMETDTNTPHQLVGPEWDLDENGQRDNYETSPRKGKVWMDTEQTRGWNYVYSQARQAYPQRSLATGGELWSPGLAGWNSQSSSWQNANLAMVSFLESNYYDASCGNDESRYWSGSACLTLPPNGEKRRLWDLHITQAAQFMNLDNNHLAIFKPAELETIQADSYNGQFFSGASAQAKYTRFLLGTAFLVNAYAQPEAKDDLPATWCDECGVSIAGLSTQRPVLANKSWMGCPLDAARSLTTHGTVLGLLGQGRRWQLSDEVWTREFQNAYLIVNPTEQQQTITLPSTGWRRISGVYDRTQNSGDIVGTIVTVAAKDALFLVRESATTTPPNTVPSPGGCDFITDLNMDGTTNLLDFSILNQYWFTTTFPDYVDIDCNGTIGLSDYTILVSHLRF